MISLDVNVIFTVVIGGGMSLIVPRIWQISKQDFKNKVITINQLHELTSSQSQTLSKISKLINKKFFKFEIDKSHYISKTIEELKPEYTSLKEEYDELNFADGNIVSTKQTHLILFGTKKIWNLSRGRNQLISEIINNYMKICYSTKPIIKISEIPIMDIMKQCKDLHGQVKKIDTLLLQEYTERFTWKYKLCHIKDSISFFKKC